MEFVLPDKLVNSPWSRKGYTFFHTFHSYHFYSFIIQLGVMSWKWTLYPPLEGEKKWQWKGICEKRERKYKISVQSELLHYWITVKNQQTKPRNIKNKSGEEQRANSQLYWSNLESCHTPQGFRSGEVLFESPANTQANFCSSLNLNPFPGP